MKILLFGVLADALGKPMIETVAVGDIDLLKKNLTKEFPLLNNYSFQFAVNKEKAEKNVSINEGDEIALLPPFAGG